MKNLSIVFISISALIASNISFPFSSPGDSQENIVLAGVDKSQSSYDKSAEPGYNADRKNSLPVLSRVAVLTIHVRDTVMHDSIFHFLTDKLGLAVEYYPLLWNERKYAGVYAGNMFLEPCGPYSNFRYATNDFRAIFFGLNCGSDRSMMSLAEDLRERRIEIMQEDVILITDSAIIKPNIYFAIAAGPIQNTAREDSLRTVLLKNKNGPGIESIKEIWIGYPDNMCLERWEKLLKPLVRSETGVWKINENQSFRFVKSSIREVNSIVFKIRSLEQAKTWMTANKLSGEIGSDEIILDKSQTFGLIIRLSEKE